MKLLTVVGARPQFIKAAALSPEFAASGIDEVLVHTGQHYDYNMSEIFFEGLKLRRPDYYLGVGSAPHAVQTAAMMERLEPVIDAVNPDWVVVYGDTNSTLAGALVAAKRNIPLAHVEAGLRSFDRTMPEEINRVVSDHVASALFAPTRTAVDNLTREGITQHVYLVGDLMVDLVRSAAAGLPLQPPIVARFGLRPGGYGVVTVHRVSNTENISAFRNIMTALRRLPFPIVFPVHPRTAPLFHVLCDEAANVIGCEPLAYLDMVALQAKARVVITDSGGMQKEAWALGVPCVTLRSTTEWPETTEGGWNALVGCQVEAIIQAAQRQRPQTPQGEHYGRGHTAKTIAGIFTEELQKRGAVA